MSVLGAALNGLGPAGGGDQTAAHIDRHEHPLGPLRERTLQQRWAGERGGAEDDTLGTRFESGLDRLQRAQATAKLDGHTEVARDALQLFEIDGLARASAVEIDHVQLARPGGHPPARGRQRVLVVHLLGIEVALDEPHGLAAENVYGGVELHERTGTAAVAQMRAKFASRRSPAALDFSGWNCTP